MHSAVHVIDSLYIGALGVIRHPDTLNQQCITHILRLYTQIDLVHYNDPLNNMDPSLPPIHTLYDESIKGFTVRDCSTPLDENISDDTFRTGVKFLRDNSINGIRTLLLSREGNTRAPIFAVAYMLEERGYDLRQALQRIKPLRYRYGVMMNDKPWMSLCRYYHLPYDSDSLWDLWRGV